ncbi:thioredoxin family protein [Chamaesiphon minutus]|uniref:Thioredoxin n=1 Tax=Chamaesiphon minutus (strain ATCC 27169 / PCC 6605) TaxID=1173020 RepID=K9UQ93_CHAP6|nr:thioredoxin domain-containing protein [Chamaesiphon minutus]AFY96975.1 thioredoxin domain-containing protein [Chamaesiphon minutus PCC 6605]
MSPHHHFIDLTAENFQTEVIHSPIPVVVDCWASWCMPFYKDNLLLDKLLQEFAGRIKICRLNVATADAIAACYSIRAVPMLLIFCDGKIVNRSIGTAQLDKIVDRLDILTKNAESNRRLISC